MTEDDLRTAERRLQAAQLAGDAAALEPLLDDRLVFTGPGGDLFTKQDDLAVQGTRQFLSRVDEEELSLLVDGRTGVTWFLGTLEGTFDGVPFAGRLRYTRTWLHTDEYGWRLVAAHMTPLA